MDNNFLKINPVLNTLSVGDRVDFPISRMKSVRVRASELSRRLSRKYLTHIDHAAQIIYVTRVK